jgi:hypothetical protein
MEARLGARAGIAQIVTPGLMPVVSLFDELSWSRPGAFAPTVRVSLSAASNGLDSNRDASFTWVAGGIDLCPLRAVLGQAVELRPCVAAQGGSLHGRGRGVAEPIAASRAWWSAGASAHAAVRLSQYVGVDLSAAALLPFKEREFVFEAPQRAVARTPTVSMAVGFGFFLML